MRVFDDGGNNDDVEMLVDDDANCSAMSSTVSSRARFFLTNSRVGTGSTDLGLLTRRTVFLVVVVVDEEEGAANDIIPMGDVSLPKNEKLLCVSAFHENRKLTAYNCTYGTGM